MPEIGTSGSMSGDGKRSAGLRPQATAPILDFTRAEDFGRATTSTAIGVELPCVRHGWTGEF